MTAIAHAARACALADRDTLFVAAMTSLALIAATAVLVHYGSFARALAAIGPSSIG